MLGFFQKWLQQKPPWFFWPRSERTLKKREAMSSWGNNWSWWGTGKRMFLEYKMSVRDPAREGKVWTTERPLRNAGNTGSTEITERKTFGVVTKTGRKFFHNSKHCCIADTQISPVRMPLPWQDTVQKEVHLQILSLLHFNLYFLPGKFVPSVFTQTKPRFWF